MLAVFVYGLVTAFAKWFQCNHRLAEDSSSVRKQQKGVMAASHDSHVYCDALCVWGLWIGFSFLYIYVFIVFGGLVGTPPRRAVVQPGWHLQKV